MPFELPPLPYDYSALEPTIDAQTMTLHHDKHHATYVTNLNNALQKYPDWFQKTPEEIVSSLNDSALGLSISSLRSFEPRSDPR